MELKNNSRFPKNYILLGNAPQQKKQAEDLVAEAEKQFPQCFEGRKKSFFFELRYAPPFDKDFRELKRLQGVAADAAGRRDEFRGYIIIDLSDYLTHEKERYLDISLRFFSDMSQDWKYIFLVDNTNPKAAKEMVAAVLSVLFQDMFLEVKEAPLPSMEGKASELLRQQGIACSASVEGFVQELLDRETFREGVVSALVQDVSACCGQWLNMDVLESYFNNRIPIVKYMLSEKQYQQLLTIFEKRKGELYETKEAV